MTRKSIEQQITSCSIDNLQDLTAVLQQLYQSPLSWNDKFDLLQFNLTSADPSIIRLFDALCRDSDEIRQGKNCEALLRILSYASAASSLPHTRRISENQALLLLNLGLQRGQEHTKNCLIVMNAWLNQNQLTPSAVNTINHCIEELFRRLDSTDVTFNDPLYSETANFFCNLFKQNIINAINKELLFELFKRIADNIYLLEATLQRITFSISSFNIIQCHLSRILTTITIAPVKKDTGSRSNSITDNQYDESTETLHRKACEHLLNFLNLSIDAEPLIHPSIFSALTFSEPSKTPTQAHKVLHLGCLVFESRFAYLQTLYFRILNKVFQQAPYLVKDFFSSVPRDLQIKFQIPIQRASQAFNHYALGMLHERATSCTYHFHHGDFTGFHFVKSDTLASLENYIEFLSTNNQYELLDTFIYHLKHFFVTPKSIFKEEKLDDLLSHQSSFISLALKLINLINKENSFVDANYVEKLFMTEGNNNIPLSFSPDFISKVLPVFYDKAPKQAKRVFLSFLNNLKNFIDCYSVNEKALLVFRETYTRLLLLAKNFESKNADLQPLINFICESSHQEATEILLKLLESDVLLSKSQLKLLAEGREQLSQKILSFEQERQICYLSKMFTPDEDKATAHPISKLFHMKRSVFEKKPTIDRSTLKQLHTVQKSLFPKESQETEMLELTALPSSQELPTPM